MVKILAIGNSFSEDATHFLHQIGEAAGVENKVVNLYIGGCSLEMHWKNIENDVKQYQYQINGIKTDRYVSISDVLSEEKWDYIVTHQASHDSGWLDTYEPFLGLILNYLKEKSPHSEIFLNQTWAYEIDSTHDRFIRYNRSQSEMYSRLSSAYKIMAEKYSLPLISCGELVQQLRATKYFERGNTNRCICRDGFHMNFLYGRYALACLWAKSLFNISVIHNSFVPHIEDMPFEDTDIEIINVIREIVENIGDTKWKEKSEILQKH